MSDNLNTVKTKLTQQHLGRHGIHGIGMSKSRGAICLYVRSKRQLEESGALEEIKIDSAPFKVLIIEEDSASFARDP
jgi:hypothetical protein